MIIVRVELLSAVTGTTTELARMHIANTGEGTDRICDYVGRTFIGRDTDALDHGIVSKRGRVTRWRRHDFHVWNLVRRMLGEMGYTR